ncbi:hypothetical protein C8R44DRAFT_676325 [Mycena epipterygia]|nr:hypothetical protein C8R44DRAFT_676325 [Mycena epipterygia]
MCGNLPDEIISEILSPALKIPDRMFSDTSPTSPFASYSASSSSALLVCKAWLRVASPLLYSIVVIRSKEQAGALQTTLQSTPELGQFVKKLRVEGGFGKVMHKIMRNTPNISDIFISIHLRSSDSCDGLLLGLPLINPTRLIIFDDYYFKNKQVEQLTSVLKICAAKWRNLNKIHFPYNRDTERESFCMALASVPTVKTVSFPNPHSSLLPYLVKLAQIPTLETIEIRTDSPQDQTLPLTSTDPRLDKLLRSAYTSTKHSTHPPKSTTCLPTDPSFRPMVSTPQAVVDRIWTRILFFAMVSVEQHPQNTSPWDLPDSKVNSARLQFLLVSKLFQRLALPYLYRYPVFIHQHNLHPFSDALTLQPTLARYLRELDIRIDQRLSWRERSRVVSAKTALTSIIPHTCQLTHLIGNNHDSISWATFITLAGTVGSTLQEFSGFSFWFPVQRATKVHSLGIFNRFTALRSFTWGCSFAREAPPVFGPVDKVSAAALPALEFLGMKTPEALSMFCKMRLPNLQHAAFEIEWDWDITLLRTHGAKIKVLEVCRATIGKTSVFEMCPNLTTLTCRVEARDAYDFGCSTLRGDFKHALLEKLIVKKYLIPGKENNEKDWEGFFLALDKDASRFPALREFHTPEFNWPTTEYEIAKSGWIESAEKLLEHGIKLTDNVGFEWRPRLKRGKGRKILEVGGHA